MGRDAPWHNQTWGRGFYTHSARDGSRAHSCQAHPISVLLTQEGASASKGKISEISDKISEISGIFRRTRSTSLRNPNATVASLHAPEV